MFEIESLARQREPKLCERRINKKMMPIRNHETAIKQ